ncbi:MAG: VTT domain-containing protein [Pseudomonadota bacterium]
MMRPIRPEDRTRVILAVGILAVAAGGIAVLAWLGKLGPLMGFLKDTFESKEGLRAYLETWGKLAPLVFMGTQVLQVVLAPIPGEFTGAVGGFMFGAVPNILYSSVALTIGSAVAFYASRIVGLPIVKLVVSDEDLARFGFLTQPRGAFFVLVLFIIPGFPKDILSFILGLSPMTFLTFITICTIGRLPGTIMLSFSGSAIYDENWILLIIMCLLCAFGFALLFIYRGSIEAWMHRTDDR